MADGGVAVYRRPAEPDRAPQSIELLTSLGTILPNDSLALAIGQRQRTEPTAASGVFVDTPFAYASSS